MVYGIYISQGLLLLSSKAFFLHIFGDLNVHYMDNPASRDHKIRDPFYVANKDLYEAAHNPGISFTELLLGDPEQDFPPDHDALAAS